MCPTFVLKKTMLSFKQLKDGFPGYSESATAGRCTGTKFIYELGDSEHSCDEAKTLLTRPLKHPLYTGTVELTEVGAWMLSGPTLSG